MAKDDKTKPEAAAGDAAEPKKGKEKKEKAPPKTTAQKASEKRSENPDFKYIVRIANTDLNGHKRVPLALTAVKGVGHRVSHLLVDKAEVARDARIGDLDDASIERLRLAVEDQILDVLPPWMVNRQKDISTGQDIHFIGVDLDGIRRDDINRMKKMRSYRGIRHDTNQKVRGQRSRSNGRTGLAMGVIKKKEGPQPGGDKKEE